MKTYLSQFKKKSSVILRSVTNPLYKKAQTGLNFLKTAVISLGIAAIFGSAIALALDRINTAGAFAADSAASNIILNGTEGVLQMFTLLPTIGIIIGIVVLIGIVLLIKVKGN